jgi:hypothetical protein
MNGCLLWPSWQGKPSVPPWQSSTITLFSLFTVGWLPSSETSQRPGGQCPCFWQVRTVGSYLRLIVLHSDSGPNPESKSAFYFGSLCKKRVIKWDFHLLSGLPEDSSVSVQVVLCDSCISSFLQLSIMHLSWLIRDDLIYRVIVAICFCFTKYQKMWSERIP